MARTPKESSLAPPSRAPFAPRLLAWLGITFLLKAGVLWRLADHPLLQPEAGLDTTAYANLAQQVLAGNLGLGPGLYYVSPLYIYFLAAGLWVFKSYTAVRVVQILLGTASVGFLFLTARAWFGEKAAWTAAVMASLTGLFTFYEILILQASIDAFLTSGALWCLTIGLRGLGAGPLVQGPRPRAGLYLVLTGLVFGVQTLNRPNVLIAVLGMAVLLAAVHRVRVAALLVAGLAAGMAPVAVRNVVVSHQWSFVSSHGGLNFYIGNGEGATGFYHLVPGIRPTIAGQEEDVRRVAERAAGRALTDSEVSDHFFTRAWNRVRAHPLQWLGLLSKKIAYVFVGKHIALPHSYPFYVHDEATLLRFLFIGPWLLVPLGLTGLLFAAPAGRRLEYAAWAAFVPAYAVAVAMFFVAERYRLPLLVPLCIGSGAAAASLWPVAAALASGARRRLRGPAASSVASGVSRSMRSPAPSSVVSGATWTMGWPAAIVFVALFAFVNWPYKLQDGRWEEGLRLAQRLVILHRYDEADHWVERLEATAPKPGATRYGVGMQLLLQGETARALVHLVRAQQLAPGDAHREYALGQALLRDGRSQEAVPHLRLGFEAGIDLPQGGLDYPVALSASGDHASAVRAAQRVTPPDDDPEAWLKLGRIAMQAQAPGAAEPFFRHAVELRQDDPAARLQYGLNLMVLGRYQEAARELGESVRLDARNPDALSRLAYSELQLGRVADARAHAQAALALAPDDPFAVQLLAAIR